jgi:hypothetical protein
MTMSEVTSIAVQLDSGQQKQLLSLALRREVSRASDRDELREMVEARAELLAVALKGNMAQIRNLENIAYSTEKVSDITDYLKQQIGRSKPGERWRHQNVGVDILTDLSSEEKFVQKQVQRIAKLLSEQYPAATDDDLPRRLRLAMCREYVRHLTAHYLYSAAERGEVDEPT